MPTGWSTAKPGPMARRAVHCDGIERLSQQRGWAGGCTTKQLESRPRHGAPLPEVIAWERGRPARILSLWPPLSFSAMLQAATPVGGNSSGQAEGEPWRRSRLIQVGEMSEAVPGLVRAGRPRSQEAIIP